MPHFSFLTHPSDSQTEAILSLYRTAGWWQAAGVKEEDASHVRDLISGSHCFLIAAPADGSDRGEPPVIGMGRSISDSVSDAYIQDVVVMPSYRGRGIATQIIKRIVDRLQTDGIGWIGLIAERNTQNLYKPIGFEPMADSTPMLRK
jgi:ribosomal protein S18 acetylase RimI-like enzyme